MIYTKTKSVMKNILVLLCVIGVFDFASAQDKQSLAGGLGLFVFPAKGQDKETQSLEEYECYLWAKDQTGINPLNPPEIQAAQVDRSADGTAVVGAARGAAAGAAIGAIGGNAGRGAAIGATAGAMRGRQAKVVGDERQQQANDRAAAAANKEQMDNFKKAFSVCLEGKGYTVR
jgi:hypothetical protein